MKMAYIRSIVMIIAVVLIIFASAINFQDGDNGKIKWSSGCDFFGNDIAQQQGDGYGALCGGFCLANSQCTHFTSYNNVCYMKKFTGSPTPTNLNGGVCGYKVAGGSGGGGGSQPNKMTSRGYTLIKCFEGLCLHAYRDVVGVWTIGYGNTYNQDGSHVHQGQTLTQSGADALFAYFVDKDFAPSVSKLVGTTKPLLTQVQFEALVSFAYNVGSGALASSALLAKVKANPNDPSIRNEFNKFVYAGGSVPIDGLVVRRKKEADYYFGNNLSVCNLGPQDCPN